MQWPRWAKSRNLYYFWLCNRGKRRDVEQARWNINFSCQDDPTGGNRTGEVNKQLLPVGYLIDLEIDLFVPGGFFRRRTGEKKLVNKPLGMLGTIELVPGELCGFGMKYPPNAPRASSWPSRAQCRLRAQCKSTLHTNFTYAQPCISLIT